MDQSDFIDKETKNVTLRLNNVFVQAMATLSTQELEFRVFMTINFRDVDNILGKLESDDDKTVAFGIAEAIALTAIVLGTVATIPSPAAGPAFAILACVSAFTALVNQFIDILWQPSESPETKLRRFLSNEIRQQTHDLNIALATGELHKLNAGYKFLISLRNRFEGRELTDGAEGHIAVVKSSSAGIEMMGFLWSYIMTQMSDRENVDNVIGLIECYCLIGLLRKRIICSIALIYAAAGSDKKGPRDPTMLQVMNDVLQSDNWTMLMHMLFFAPSLLGLQQKTFSYLVHSTSQLVLTHLCPS